MKATDARLSEQRRALILHGRLLPTLLMLTFPSLLMAGVDAAVPIVDSMFINHLLGGVAAGAISFCGPFLLCVNSVGRGLCVAAMAILGQTNGQGDFSLARRVAVQVLVLSISLSLLLVPAVMLLAVPLTQSVTPEIVRDARTYLMLSSLILPFTFATAQYMAIQNAAGRPEKPLGLMVVFFVLKTAANFLLLYALRMGVAGAALATVIAHGGAGLYALWDLFATRDRQQRLTLRGYRPDGRILQEVFRVGLPAMLQGAVLEIGFVLMNFQTQQYGALALTGLSISSSLNGFAFTIPEAMAGAVTTLVSMNMGSGNPARARRACLVALALTLLLSLAACAVLLPLGPRLTRLFTSDPETLEVADWALRVMVFSSFGFSTCMVVLAAFNGLGNTRVPFVVNVLRIWAIRYVFALACQPFMGLDAIIVCNLFANYAAAGLALVLFMRLKWVSSLSRDFAGRAVLA